MCPVLAGICGATFLEGVLVFTFLVHSIHCVLYTSGEADLSIYTSLMVIYIYIYIYTCIYMVLQIPAECPHDFAL